MCPVVEHICGYMHKMIFNTIYKVDTSSVWFPWWWWWWNYFSPQMSFSRHLLDNVLAAGVSTTASHSLAFTLFQQLEVEQADSRRQPGSKRSKDGGTEPICQPEQSHLTQTTGSRRLLLLGEEPAGIFMLVINNHMWESELQFHQNTEAQTFPKHLKGQSGGLWSYTLSNSYHNLVDRDISHRAPSVEMEAKVVIQNKQVSFFFDRYAFKTIFS